MRWFDSPPCTRLDLTFTSDDRLALSGPSADARVMGGATAAFGGVFAGMSLRFLRLPIPAPLKLIPLAFAAVGGGLGALGAASAFSSCKVEAKRGDGLTFRWKLPLREERSLRLHPGELEGFEVTEHEQRQSGDSVAREYRVVAVTKVGWAVEVESFGTRTQAQLRKEAFKKILLPA